jgi:Glycosyltransferase family 87
MTRVGERSGGGGGISAMKLTGEAFRRYGPLLAGVAFAVAYFPRFRVKGIGGLWAYPAAAECMLRGEVPIWCKSTLFFYPPVFALLFIPIALLPGWLRDAVWYLVTLGSFVVLMRTGEALARHLFPGEWTDTELTRFRVLAFVLNAKFMLHVLENQAYDSLVVMFFMLGFLALVRNRSVLAGASFGMAIALKASPLIALPYLLIKRRFAAVAMLMAVAAGLTMLPDLLLPPKKSWHVVEWFYEVVLGPLRGYSNVFEKPLWTVANPLNQSFRGIVSRFIDGQAQPNEFALVLSLFTGLWIVAASVPILKALPNDRLIPIDGAILAVSMLLLSPVTSRSHFIALVLPLAILAAAAFRERSLRWLTIGTLIVSFMFLTLSTGDQVGSKISGWSLWYGIPMWGVLILAVPLSVLTWAIGSRAKAAA